MAWPADNIEIVRKIAHEGDGRSDGAELVVAQCGSSNGEGTTLALSLGKEVLHIARRAAGHEVNSAQTVHIGTTIVVLVFVAELVCKPVAIDIREVLLDTIVTPAGRTVVDALSTIRQYELCEVGTLFRVPVGIDTPRSSAVATWTIFRVVAWKWMSTGCFWPSVGSA